MQRKTRVFHLDDHRLFTDGIKALLRDEPQFEWLGSAPTLADGLARCRQLKPDLVLLDYFLPDGNGLMAATILMNELPQTHLILLTMDNSPGLSKECRQLGLGACLLKTIGRQELLEAIGRVLRFQQVYPSLPAPSNAGSAGGYPSLSKREREIAILVAQGLTSQAIAEKLRLSLLTVSTHRRNLMRKLDVNNTAQLIARLAESRNGD